MSIKYFMIDFDIIFKQIEPTYESFKKSGLIEIIGEKEGLLQGKIINYSIILIYIFVVLGYFDLEVDDNDDKREHGHREQGEADRGTGKVCL